MRSMYVYTHLWSQSCLTSNTENMLLGLAEKYLHFFSANIFVWSPVTIFVQFDHFWEGKIEELP